MQKDYSWNPIICICEDSKYLKSVAYSSVTECDEIVIVMDVESTKKTNTIATNVMSAASIYCHSKKVRDCYILHTCFSLAQKNMSSLQQNQISYKSKK